MSLQERYDKLKRLDAKALARLVPADCKPKPIPRRAPFVPNAPARFDAMITRASTPGMRFVERPDGCYPNALDAKAGTLAYIQAFEFKNSHVSVKYELVSGALFPDALPEPLTVPEIVPEPLRTPTPCPAVPILRAKRYVITQDGRRIAA